jgi:nitronate monooxygenase
MWPNTALTKRLGIKYPIIQAPLASISTAPMAAAVSDTGALGSIGSANMTPRAVADQLRAVRELTAAPFAVNFFVHEPPREDEEVARRMRDRLEGYRLELGAEPSRPWCQRRSRSTPRCWRWSSRRGRRW